MSEDGEVGRALMELNNFENNDVENNNYKKGTEKEEEEEPERLTNYGETLMHVLKSNVGSGLFAMGNAFKNSGLALGTVLVVVIGIICVYCQHLMLNVCDETARKLKRKHPVGFEEAAKLSFELGHPKWRNWSNTMGRAVQTFVCITQSGFCCIYIVFIATNLKQVWDIYLPELSLSVMMCIVIVPLILLSWVRDMKSLAPLSILANILMLAGVIIVIVIAAPDLPSISERRLVSPLSMLPLFFGTVIYTFEGIGLVTPIKIKSKNPQKFGNLFGPLNIGMMILGVLIISLGFIGYLRWGDEVKDSVTLNLDEESVIGQVVKIAICLGVLFTYPIQLYPAISNFMPIFQKLFGPFKRPVLAETIIRTLYGLLLFALAELIPHLALFISLVGAVSSTALALIIPPLMDLVTFYDDFGKFYWRIWRNSFIVLFGLFGFATGTFYSLKEIIETFSK